MAVSKIKSFMFSVGTPLYQVYGLIQEYFKTISIHVLENQTKNISVNGFYSWQVNLKHSLIKERACDKNIASSITQNIYIRCEMKQESTSKDILIKERTRCLTAYENCGSMVKGKMSISIH